MPDISLRFHKDMLVISSPMEAALASQGVDVERDLGLMTLIEADSLSELLRIEAMSGAQCLVAPTAGITPARLAHAGMEDRAAEIATAAVGLTQGRNPQHLLVELGPCGLPLDASSKASLNENRSQYARAARLFADLPHDAFFLNGFATTSDLLCALMGVRQASDAPIIASVDLLPDGSLASGRGTLEEACATMREYGTQVAGFSTAAGIDAACELAKRMLASCGELPLLAQLSVKERAPKQGGPTPENPYYCPDTMVDAAFALRACGSQFLRAAGNASPAYTGALAATTMGLDAMRTEEAGESKPAGAGAEAAGTADAGVDASATSVGGDQAFSTLSNEELDSIAENLRAKISQALQGGASTGDGAGATPGAGAGATLGASTEDGAGAGRDARG